MEKRNLLEEDELLTPEELAEMLKMSVFFIYRETSRRNRGIFTDLIPPHIKIGGAVRFRSSSVVRWLEEKESGTAA